jgi:hypothetical protein
MDAMISGRTSLFDTKGPIALCSARCWAPLYSGVCGVARSSWTAATALTAITGGKLVLGNSGPNASEDHFRFGYAERLLPGGIVQRYRISGSTAAANGASVTLSIVGQVSPVPSAYPESGWVLVPGCDKTFSRCKVLGGKHRGFPHFPKTNPALVAVKNTTGSGGKK